MAGSVAVLVGLLFVRAGFAQGDASAALVIVAIILATATRLIAENANVLMDRTPSEAREAAERALARLESDIELVRLRLRESAAEPLVKEVHDITIYQENGSASISLHLKFPTDLDLQAALAVAERVEQAIHARPDVSDVQTHLEPLERPLIASPGNPSTNLDVMRTTNRIVLELTGTPPQRTSKTASDPGRSRRFRHDRRWRSDLLG
jgi:divalent metal cation (Fe/Co/Zn/Cd) transporter